MNGFLDDKYFYKISSYKNRRRIKRNPYYNPHFKKPYVKKKRIHFRLQLVMKKKNPDKKRYFAFFLKTKNNVFVTITDVNGRVVVSQSAGKCKITTKKKKRSWDTLKAVAESASKIARLKNIRYIYKLFMTTTYLKNAKIIFHGFKKSGVRILQNFIIKKVPHSLPMRKKKLKRL